MSRTIKNLEFAVDDPSGNQRIFKTWSEAAGYTVSLAASDGEPHNVDVLAWSRAAARAWAGDDGVASYDDDPEASVFERIEIRAESKGRIA